VDEFECLTRQELISLILEQRQTITMLQQRILALENKSSGPPPFVRANVRRKQEKQERKKRSQSFVRKREEPTEVCLHAASHCPDCGRTLSGGTEHRRRQVIELPQTPVMVTDHVVLSRWCGVCHKRVLPTLDLSSQVVGQHRLGVRLMSLIAYLKTTLRLPVRQITALLKSLYGLRLSAGEVCEVLHRVAACGKAEYHALQQQVRGSPYVHADETGWRQDGQNGYLWSFSTPRIRYFHYDKSRAGSVAQEVLGEQFGGITVSDFYGGYNSVGVVRQRCWVHFLRDLHALTEAHPDEEAVQEWAGQVRQVYDEACAFQECARAALARHGQNAASFGYGVFARVRRRKQFEEQLLALAQPWLQEDVPQRVLSARVAQFVGEMYLFVEHVGVPSQNNAAERSVRPAVIARKVSGGTRSAQGSATKSVLLSLFGTWQAQGQDALEACGRMLVGTPSQDQTLPASL
jgi:transposase